MEVLNMFEQIYNELLLYTMMGEIEWLSETVGKDIFYEANWLEYLYQFIDGDNFINVFLEGQRQFIIYLAEYQSRQLSHVISNKHFDWNKLPRRI